MNLHQFRFVQEAVRRNLNLTETAKALFTSQPGISKAILELEDELGVDIFARHGKRLRRVTEPGAARCCKLDRDHHARGRQPEAHRRGVSRSRTPARCRSRPRTRQARYVLPEPVAQLRKRFPKVQVSLHQGAPDQVAQMVLRRQVADIGLATESLAELDDLVTLPCYEWQHVIVMPRRTPAGRRSSASRSKSSRTSR